MNLRRNNLTWLLVFALVASALAPADDVQVYLESLGDTVHSVRLFQETKAQVYMDMISGVFDQDGKAQVVHGWYALADEIAEQSGFDRGDARDFAFKFAQGLVRHLKFGDYVKLGEIGSFGVSCDKDKKLKATYRAAQAINDELADDFRGEFIYGENAGLDDEGYARRWLELHPADTVIMRDGTTRTAGN